MTEPTRLLDDPNAPEGATSLLSALSAPELPSRAKEAALAQQLATMTAPGAATAAATGSALWLKAALVVGALGIAGLWGAHALRAPARPVPQPAPIASLAPPNVTEAAAPAPQVPEGQPTDIPNPKEAPALPHVKGAIHDSLADEEALLEQARQAAVSSPSKALGLLHEYQQRFPRGQLNAERMFLSVDVLTRLGQQKAAQKQADALIRAFPSSVYAAQVKARSSAP